MLQRIIYIRRVIITLGLALAVVGDTRPYLLFALNTIATIISLLNKLR